MRTLLPLLLLPVATFGCAETCPTPQQINSRSFDMFTNAITWTISNEENFPGESSPANGFASYEFSWGTALVEAPVSVIIDEQPFNGEGTWDDQECGNFFVSWGGSYTAEGGSTHDFAAVGLFRWWLDNLEGQLEWAETWTAADGAVGTFESSGQMRGSQLGAGIATQ